MKNCIILLGRPGSGKGTVGSALCEKYGSLIHISTGELLRSRKNEKDALSIEITRLISGGNYVPDDMIQNLIKEIIPAQKDDIILDGFPRTLPQLCWFQQQQSALSLAGVLFVYLDVSEDCAMSRLSGRYICTKCGCISNKNGSVFQCPCGEAYRQTRKDDRDFVIKERFEIYKKHTHPIIEYLAGNKAFCKINAETTTNIVFGQVDNEIVNFKSKLL